MTQTNTVTRRTVVSAAAVTPLLAVPTVAAPARPAAAGGDARLIELAREWRDATMALVAAEDAERAAVDAWLSRRARRAQAEAIEARADALTGLQDMPVRSWAGVAAIQEAAAAEQVVLGREAELSEFTAGPILTALSAAVRMAAAAEGAYQ